MITKRRQAFIAFGAFVMAPFCSALTFGPFLSAKENSANLIDADTFKAYWYSGQAEINRYALEQARYGEIRKGDAVLIFVTEDFLTDKQVKHEFGESENSTSVLKLNATRKFYTGIYPYSMMTSVFTPVQSDKYSTLKVTTTSQEWCGQTFSQINSRGSNYEVTLRSYFQGEGDQNFEIDGVLLEDEVWTRIRLAPDQLPTGGIRIVPGTQFTRLRHIPIKVSSATAKLSTEKDAKLSKEEIGVYSISYNDFERVLVIRFEKNFPHAILAWEETNKSGYGPDAKTLTTRAVRTQTMKSDYWSKNKLSDSHLRDELGLIY